MSFSTAAVKLYSVKLMKSSRKSEYSVQKLKSSGIFGTIEDLIQEIKASLNVTPVNVGYIEPGHGLKGKQRWLINDDDLDDMYCIYERKKEVILWCHCVCASASASKCSTPKRVKKKRSRENDSDETTNPSKKATIMNKILEVEEIVKELQERHGTARFTVEQLNSWAHMLQLKKHSSYDVPPDLPYFKGCNSGAKVNKPSTVQPMDVNNVTPVGVSPGKRLNLRSECISQLDK